MLHCFRLFSILISLFNSHTHYPTTHATLQQAFCTSCDLFEIYLIDNCSRKNKNKNTKVCCRRMLLNFRLSFTFPPLNRDYFIPPLYLFIYFLLFRAIPMAYGSCQARGLKWRFSCQLTLQPQQCKIRASSVTCTTTHSHA